MLQDLRRHFRVQVALLGPALIDHQADSLKEILADTVQVLLVLRHLKCAVGPVFYGHSGFPFLRVRLHWKESDDKRDITSRCFHREFNLRFIYTDRKVNAKAFFSLNFVVDQCDH